MSFEDGLVVLFKASDDDLIQQHTHTTTTATTTTIHVHLCMSVALSQK